MDPNSSIDSKDINPSASVDLDHNSSNEPVKKKRKSHLVAVLIFIIFILGLLLTISVYLLLNKSVTTKSSTNDTAKKDDIENVEVADIKSEPYSENIAFLRDGELHLNNKNGEIIQISGKDKGVKYFAQSSDSSIIVYIEGEKSYLVANLYYNVDAEAVYLYSIENKQSKKIYELPLIKYPNSDYVSTIRDIGMSNDATQVAITTSDSLLVYDVLNETIETIFSLPPADKLRPLIYAYADPIFSPDKGTIIFKKGYYEGHSYGTVSLSDKSVKDTPYSGYIAGQTVLGWLNNSTLIIQDYDAMESGSAKALIQTVDLDNLENPSTIHNFKGSILSSFIEDENLYSLVTYSIPNYDVYPDTGTAYHENYSAIYKFSLISDEKQTLSTTKQEVIIENAISQSYSNIRLSSDKSKLFISSFSGINNKGSATPDYRPEILILDIKSLQEPEVFLKEAYF